MQSTPENRVTTQTIFELIGQHASRDKLLQAMVAWVESIIPEAIVAIMEYDQATNTLSLASGVHFSAEFQKELQQIDVASNGGTCCIAAHSRKVAITENFLTDTTCPRFKHVATAEQLKACWATPVIGANNDLKGTFSAYFREPRKPTEREIKLIKRAASMIALAFDHQREHTLRNELNERYASLFRNHPDAVFELDMNGNFVAANDATTKLSGFPERQMLGTHYSTFIIDEYQPLAISAFEKAKTGEPQSLEVAAVHANNGQFWLAITILPIIINHVVVGVFGIGRDITVQVEQKEYLENQRTHDTLTGLPNRTYFEQSLNNELKRSHAESAGFAVLYIDLDDFRSINEGLGHEVGDELLAAVAERILSCTCKQDTVSRLAADEFVVLLPSLHNQQFAIKVAEEILQALTQPFQIGRHQLALSASIGISSVTQHTRNAAEIIKQADIAMSEAKRQGCNTWHWYEGETALIGTEYTAMRLDIAEAIEQKQFVIHYQPIVASETGITSGYEALIRWCHPTRGMIAPCAFIPLAERTGQIIAIGQQVLHRACKEIAAWNQKHKKSMNLAVNISPLQFRRASFLDEVISALQKSGLPAEMLELEVTESVLVLGAERTIDILQKIRALGVRVAIDDFGTGYSSLSYLRYLPIDKIKIDRSFVQHLPNNREDCAIVQGLITMAHHLGLAVVAEGVETKEQGEFLKNIECDLLQGFYFARPALL
ncbi:EAL domain-containing protein [Aliidiomarina sp.]|uniref:bifunctional diguanylate cyclase/phosphodiesterase n=1 Tax=Aliidiomarina sp. TaxID=1872439 RepID=UPI003A4D438A